MHTAHKQLFVLELYRISVRYYVQRQREINGNTRRIEEDICNKYKKGDIELAEIAVFILITNYNRWKMSLTTKR